MGQVKNECWFALRYAGRYYCKHDVVQPPHDKQLEELVLGCPEDCPHYDPVPWRTPEPTKEEHKP